MPKIPIYTQQIIPSGGISPTQASGKIAQINQGAGFSALASGLENQLQAGMQEKQANLEELHSRVQIQGLEKQRQREKEILAKQRQHEEETLAIAAKRQQEEDGKVYALNVLSQAKTDWLLRYNEMTEKAEPGAPGFTADFISQFDKYHQETLKKAPSPEAQRFLDERLRDLRLSFLDDAVRFQARSKTEYRVSTIENSIQNMGQAVFLRPDLYEKSLAEQKAVIESLDVPGDVRAKLMTQAVGKISESAAEAILARDPAGIYNQIRTGKLVGPLRALSADRLDRLFSMSEREIELRQRAIEVQKREALRDLNRQWDNASAALLRTGDPGITGDLIRKTAALGDAQAAEEMGVMVDTYKAAYGMLKKTADQPFQDRLATVNTLEPAIDDPHYQIKAKAVDFARRVVAQDLTEFRKDPAGYVMPQAVQDLSTIGKENNLEAVTDRSLELQRDYGVTVPMVLGKERAQDLKAQYQAIQDPEQKLQFMEQLNNYGKHERSALAELDLGPAQNFAVMMGMDKATRPLARTLISLADITPTKIGYDAATADNPKKDVAASFYSDSMGETMIRQALVTGTPDTAGMAKELENLTVKYALFSNGNVKRAMTDLWDNNFNFINDDNLAHVWLPKKGVEQKEVRNALAGIRDHLKSEDLNLTFADREGLSGEYLFDHFVKDGIWVNSADGSGFTLYDPVTNRAIPDKDGRPFTISMEQVISYKGPESLRETYPYDIFYGTGIER